MSLESVAIVAIGGSAAAAFAFHPEMKRRRRQVARSSRLQYALLVAALAALNIAVAIHARNLLFTGLRPIAAALRR
jgi:hypothetical protein